MGGGGGEEEGDRDWDPKAAVAGEVEEFEERAGDDGVEEGVETVGEGGVDVDQTAEGGGDGGGGGGGGVGGFRR